MIKNKVLQKLSLSLLFFLMAFSYGYFKTQHNKIEKIAKKIESELISKDKKADQFLDEMILKIKTEKQWSTISKIIPENLYKKFGLLFLIYKNDTLLYWSENAVPVDFLKLNELKQNTILKLQNGWFKSRSAILNEYQIISLMLIKNEYNYQNEYLVNEFQKGFNLPSQISIGFEKANTPVRDVNGKFLFSIQSTTSLQLDDQSVYILLIFYIIAFIFFISFLYEMYCKLKVLENYPFLKFVLFFFDIFLLRVLLFVFRMPSSSSP
jgi:hypothetical protein